MIRTAIRNVIGGLPLAACIVGLCLLFGMLQGGKADAATPKHTAYVYFDHGPNQRVDVDKIVVRSCGIDDDPLTCDVTVGRRHGGARLFSILNHGGRVAWSAKWHQYSAAETYVYVDRNGGYDEDLYYMPAAYWHPLSVDPRTGDLRVHHGLRMGWVRPKFYRAALLGVNE